MQDYVVAEVPAAVDDGNSRAEHGAYHQGIRTPCEDGDELPVELPQDIRLQPCE